MPDNVLFFFCSRQNGARFDQSKWFIKNIDCHVGWHMIYLFCVYIQLCSCESISCIEWCVCVSNDWFNCNQWEQKKKIQFKHFELENWKIRLKNFINKNVCANKIFSIFLILILVLSIGVHQSDITINKINKTFYLKCVGVFFFKIVTTISVFGYQMK